MKKLLLALLLAGSLPASSQNYTIQLESGTFMPIAASYQLSPTLDELVNNRYYRLIQFYQIPTQDQKASIEAKGVKLYNYLPNNCYMASIPYGTLLSSINKEGNVRSLFPLTTSLKLSSELKSGKQPGYALHENGNLDVILLHHPDITTAQAAQSLLEKGYEIAFLLPEQNGIRLQVAPNKLTELAALPFIYFIEPLDINPQPEDVKSATDHRSNTIATVYKNGLKYDGTGISIALNDDGVIGPHIDYTGRLINQYITFDNGAHGDHTGGIIMGAGNVNPTAHGMAFGADLGVYGVSGSFASTYQAFDSIYNHYISKSTRIISTSYGDGNNTGYTSRARLMDLQINSMPELMHVFSAGNSGTSNFSYGAGAGWGNITGGHKQAKNVITVGNLTEIDALASSSSRGPAKDGRIKPDICAVGTNVNSTLGPNTYQLMSGTSMACPGVAGTLAQLEHAYKALHNNIAPPSSLMKACILNTGDDLGNVGPDYKFGYGRINARRAYSIIANNQFLFDSVVQNNSKTHSITIPSGVAELRVMVYWHDKEATAGVSKALVNNLDMSVVTPSAQTVLPWILNKTATVAALNSLATQGVDTLNNMEQVTIANPAAGNYTVSVVGTAVPFGPQKYVVVYEFVYNDITLTYPLGGESLVPGTSEIIRWDALGNTGVFTLQYTVDSGMTWVNIGNSTSGSDRHYYWTPPATVTGKALVKVSRGTTSDVSDATFSIIGVPNNLVVNWVCLDSFKVSYSAVTGATGYIVTVLGNKYMDSAATSNTTSCVVHGINTLQAGWYSVQAIGPNGCIGRRAIAKTRTTAPFNCVITDDLSLNNIDSPNDSSIFTCQPILQSDSLKITISNNGLNPLSNVRVNYTLNGATIITDTITTPIPAATQISYTFSQPISFSTPGVYTIQCWIEHPSDTKTQNDSLTITKHIIQPPSAVLPLVEDFESFTNCATTADCETTTCALKNGWTNDINLKGDDIDWRVLAGPAPSVSSGTGPTQDFSPGTTTGHYLYLESDNCSAKTAHLISPCIDLTSTNNMSLKFAYHLYGSGMGSLHIDALVNDVWMLDIAPAISGNQGNSWKSQTIALSSFNGKLINLRFRGITGTNGTSDMAIDAIRIAAPNTVATLNEEPLLTIAPNPSQDLFNLSLPKGNYELKVTDINGRLILKTSTHETNNSINLKGQPSGIYMLTITHPTGVWVRKLVKQ